MKRKGAPAARSYYGLCWFWCLHGREKGKNFSFLFKASSLREICKRAEHPCRLRREEGGWHFREKMTEGVCKVKCAGISRREFSANAFVFICTFFFEKKVPKKAIRTFLPKPPCCSRQDFSAPSALPKQRRK